LTQVKVKSDGEGGNDTEEGEYFWDWILDIFESSDESSSDGESGGLFDNVHILDGENGLFSFT